MSEIGKKECKSEIDLSYSDLRILFESSEPEPIDYFAGKIPCYGKNFFDYQKVAATEKNLEKIKSEQRLDTAKARSDEDGNVLAEHLPFSESFFNESTRNEQENDKLKIIFKSSEFHLASTYSGEDAMSDNDDKSSSEECSEAQDSSKLKLAPIREPSKDSFFSGLCPSLSMTSSNQRNVLKFLAKEHSIFETLDLDDCYSIWNYEVQAQKMTFEQRLKKDLCDHRNLSVEVCFGKIRFRCHKFVLRSSKLFRKWVEKSYTFTAEKELTAVAFSFFYIFSMGMKPRIPSKQLLGVRSAAKILDIDELEKYCMKLLDSDLYQENEAFEILKTASLENSSLIQSLMMQRIFKFFLPLIASRDFIEMNVDDVCNLLKCDTIGVNSEIEVFLAAILWLNSKWKDRNEKVLKRVMSCVRYGLMPPWFTYTLKKRTGIIDVDRVIQCKSVSKMIENGASVAATISLFFLDKSKFECILKRVQPKVPKQRHWIYDKNCTYHYGAHEKVSEAIDYMVFKDYLKVLQMEGKNYWCNFSEGSSNHFMKIFCQKFSDTTWSKMRF